LDKSKQIMEKPTLAGKSPVPVQLEAGKQYAWCSCGNSSKQPLCDGSHKGSSFSPKVFTATETKTAYMCTCKQTSNPDGFCDGSHKAL
jgi:CDGSH-type Zn-finger protein